MSKIIRYLPELQGDEQVTVAQLIKDMSEEQAHYFAHVHRQRRKDETVVLLTALVGLFGIAGVHRFYLGQVGMGLLYFLTGGLCMIGSIIDMFNYKQITSRYNIQQANEVAQLIRGAFPDSSSRPDQLAEPQVPRTPPPPAEGP